MLLCSCRIPVLINRSNLDLYRSEILPQPDLCLIFI